jgi:hypothetical protein
MGEPVFCTCRQPDNGSIMVQCNYCKEWYYWIKIYNDRYHIDCVGIASDALDNLKEYRCPPCEQSFKTRSDSLEGNLQKTRRGSNETAPKKMRVPLGFVYLAII